MKNIDIIIALNRYSQTEDKKILSELLEQLNHEYSLEQLKKSEGMTAVKRQKAIEKIFKDNAKDGLAEKFSKAFLEDIKGEEKQVIFSRYYAVALNGGHFVSVEQNADGEKSPMSSVLPSERYAYQEIPLDIAEAKKKLSEWKAEQKSKAKADREECCTLEIGCFDEIGFNAEYLISLYDILSGSGEVKFYQNLQRTAISYLESEVGIAILCPVRINKEK